MVHGLAVSHRYLMPPAAQPAPRYPVRVVDLPGFGLSDEPGWVLDVPELADWLAEWLITVGVAPAALLENSFGCQVAVERRRPPPGAGPVPGTGRADDRPARSDRPRQVLRWRRDLRHEDLFQLPIILRDVAGGRQPASGSRSVSRSSRSCRGCGYLRRDQGQPRTVVSQRWAEEAARLLPHGELAVVPGSPHDADYTAPEGLAALVLPFLDRVSAQLPG
jgi:pimeloyl-ACP methyl ester carboxylesterase